MCSAFSAAAAADDKIFRARVGVSFGGSVQTDTYTERLLIPYRVLLWLQSGEKKKEREREREKNDGRIATGKEQNFVAEVMFGWFVSV